MRRLGRILFRVVLVVVLLEVTVRIGELTRSTLQTIKYRVADRDEDAYRVLCLGGCVAIRGWPVHLAAALSVVFPRVDFDVVNRGNALQGIDRLSVSIQDYLDEYDPATVVVMIKYNQSHDTDGEISELQSEKTAIFRSGFFAEHSRLYQLGQILEEDLSSQLELWWGKWRTLLPSSVPGDQLALARIYDRQDRLDQARATFEQYIEEHPDDPAGYEMLGRFLIDRQDFVKHRSFLKEGITQYRLAAELYRRRGESDPTHRDYLLKACSCYGQDADGQKEAEVACRRYMKLNPDDARAYETLDKAFRFSRHVSNRLKREARHTALEDGAGEQSQEEAERHLNRQRFRANQEIFYREWKNRFPDSSDAYRGLIAFQSRTGLHNRDRAAARALLEEMEQRFLVDLPSPRGGGGGEDENDRSEIAAWLAPRYLAIGAKEKALDLYLLAETLSSGEVPSEVLRQIAFICEELGRSEEAHTWMERVKENELRMVSQGQHEEFFRRLQKIQDKVAGSGRKLVVMSFPFRSVEVLRHGLSPHENVLFVDNLLVFEEALRKKPIREYFVEYKRPFKYTSSAGSRLIADAVARTLHAELGEQQIE